MTDADLHALGPQLATYLRRFHLCFGQQRTTDTCISFAELALRPAPQECPCICQKAGRSIGRVAGRRASSTTWAIGPSGRLRHTATTLMLLGNINIKDVSVTLGHADVGTTLNVYSHFMPERAE